MRSPISKRQAANSVVGNITRSMESALANEWDVKPYHRNYNLPQSSLSRVIFNMILGTDDGGLDYRFADVFEKRGLYEQSVVVK